MRANYLDNGVAAFVEKTVPVVVVPRDDITGKVIDYSLGSILATVNPAVVMQGPVTGYADIITGTDSLRLFLDAFGNFKTPKWASAQHRLRAFMTNGIDSSYVSTTILAKGDANVNLKVFRLMRCLCRQNQ